MFEIIWRRRLSEFFGYIDNERVLASGKSLVNIVFFASSFNGMRSS